MLAGSIGMLPSASLDAPRQGALRADPRLGAGHRRPGHGQPAGDDPVAGDDVPLHVRARRRRGPHRGAPCAACSQQGFAHRRHRVAGRAGDRHARDGRRGRAALRDGHDGRPTAAIVVRRAEPARRRGASTRLSRRRRPWPGRCSCRIRRSECGASAWPRLPPDDFLLVAEVDGEVVGNLGLHAVSKSPRRRHAGAIGMSVRDDRQGRGVGTALLTAAIDLADNWLNYQRLELYRVHRQRRRARVCTASSDSRSKERAERSRSATGSMSTRIRWRGWRSPRAEIERGR